MILIILIPAALYIIRQIALGAKSAKLRKRFNELGDPRGRTLEDISQQLGRTPDLRNDARDGTYAAAWRTQQFRTTLLFSASDVCMAVGSVGDDTENRRRTGTKLRPHPHAFNGALQASFPVPPRPD